MENEDKMVGGPAENLEDGRNMAFCLALTFLWHPDKKWNNIITHAAMQLLNTQTLMSEGLFIKIECIVCII